MKTSARNIGIALALVALFATGGAAADGVAKIAGDNRVQLDVALGTSTMLAGQTQRAYLKVGLTGFALEEADHRAPVNVAIVLDRSGSMSGDKLRKAKEAAIMAIDRLGPEDIVSVVAYNHTVEVLVPSTKVRDRAEIYRQIHRLYPSGNTALFAGVSKGAHQVRKFLDVNRINRVILLSDGLANVGPSSPGDLGDLGRSFAKEGVSVTTIGLGGGYNEDLMFELARQSDGNHAFAESATDLARIFTYEFGDLLSVVAREVIVDIQCAPGIRPIRVLGRDAEISGRRVISRLNQLYSNQEKFLLVEVEVPASPRGSRRDVASVDVRYANTVTRSTDIIGGRAEVDFTDSMAVVDRSRNDGVMVASVELIANEANKEAVVLRDSGRALEAQRKLEDNARYLEKAATKYKSKKLKRRAAANRADKEAADPAAPAAKWNKQRKAMRDYQFEADMQQAW